MDGYKRKNRQMAQAVSAGLNVDILWGCVSAWAHMRSHDVPRDVALRVLSKAGPRRDSDEEHPALRDARMAQRPTSRRLAQGTDTVRAPALARRFPLPRTNHDLARLIDSAIQLMAVRNRHYAEALLRMYAIQTPTIMRVLFDTRHRRAAVRNQRRPSRLPGNDS